MRPRPFGMTIVAAENLVRAPANAASGSRWHSAAPRTERICLLSGCVEPPDEFALPAVSLPPPAQLCTQRSEVVHPERGFRSEAPPKVGGPVVRRDKPAWSR